MDFLTAFLKALGVNDSSLPDGLIEGLDDAGLGTAYTGATEALAQLQAHLAANPGDKNADTLAKAKLVRAIADGALTRTVQAYAAAEEVNAGFDDLLTQIAELDADSGTDTDGGADGGTDGDGDGDTDGDGDGDGDGDELDITAEANAVLLTAARSLVAAARRGGADPGGSKKRGTLVGRLKGNQAPGSADPAPSPVLVAAGGAPKDPISRGVSNFSPAEFGYSPTPGVPGTLGSTVSGFANALLAGARTIDSGGERTLIAFPTGSDRMPDMEVFQGGKSFTAGASDSPPFLTAAAGCEEAEPSWGFCGTDVVQSLALWASLPRKATTRSRWAIRQRTSLSEFDVINPATGWPTGSGIWTLADDAQSAGNVTKDSCAEPTCTESEIFELNAFWRCASITNMELLTDPEKIEDFVRKTMVAWGRAFTRDLIDRMLTVPGARYVEASAGSYTVGGLGSAQREFFPLLNELIAQIDHNEGWGESSWELVAMDYVRVLIENEVWRRRRTNGTVADRSRYVNEWLKGELNIDVKYTNVGASGQHSGWKWNEIPYSGPGAYVPGATPPSAGVIGDPGTITFAPHIRMPDGVPFLLYRPGTIQVADRGYVQMGTSGNPDGSFTVYDNATNATNRFKIWFEQMAGVGSSGCPFWVGNLTDICESGTLIGDVNGTC